MEKHHNLYYVTVDHCYGNIIFSELVYEEKISVHLLAAANRQTCTRALQVLSVHTQWTEKVFSVIQCYTIHILKELGYCMKYEEKNGKMAVLLDHVWKWLLHMAFFIAW